MKKLLLVLTIALLLGGCSKPQESPTSDQITKIDGAREVDMSGYEGMSDYNHHFLEVTTEEMLTTINSDGSGIFYLGSTTCSMCQYGVRLMERAASEEDVTIYYVDVYSEEDGFGDSQKYVMETLDPILMEYEGEKAIMTPHVFVVKDGEFVASLVGLDNSYDGTEATEDNQVAIYSEMFAKLY